MMSLYVMIQPFLLATLFIKEQLKEPIALFWTVISPVVTYYLITYTKVSVSEMPYDYLFSTSWFYAFISSSVALFGLAFYVVGRRESGFLRSFVYTGRTKMVFLVGQFLAYSVVSIVYCSVFYLLTRIPTDFPSVAEYFVIVTRFYICFLLFSTPALLLTLVPLGFQNTSTAFSMLSLAMLTFGVVSMGSTHPIFAIVNFLNPLWWANTIMLHGLAECWPVVAGVVALLLCSFF